MAREQRPSRIYRRDLKGEIAAIDRKRRRGGFSHEQLAGRAGVGRSTWLRMRRTGLAFPRHVRALKQALGALEREARRTETQYGEL